jgi:hypothetical protein
MCGDAANALLTVASTVTNSSTRGRRRTCGCVVYREYRRPDSLEIK